MNCVTRLNTEKLIKLVSNHRELYDGKNKDYGDMHKRDLIWQGIAKEMGVTADLCKAKWNILRGGYRRALRNRMSGYSFGTRKWRFEDDLSFLKECVMDRRRQPRRSEKNETVSDNEEEFTVVKEEPTEIVYESLSDNVQEDEWGSSCGSLAPTEAELMKLTQCQSPPKKHENGSEGDGLRQFFLSLAETVKTLPPLVQAQVKAEVFRAVNTAELNYLQGKQ